VWWWLIYHKRETVSGRMTVSRMLFHTLQLLLGWDSWISYGFYRSTILKVLNAGGSKFQYRKSVRLQRGGRAEQLNAFPFHVCIHRQWNMSHCMHCVCCFVPAGEVKLRCDLHPAIKMQFIASCAPLCTTFHFD